MCTTKARFWLVMRDTNTLVATVRHDCREKAKEEAFRLARANPGTRFFVAAVTGVASIPAPSEPPVEWVELRRED